jgi:hypothetical protein
MVEELLAILDRNDVVEAVDPLEDAMSMRRQ